MDAIIRKCADGLETFPGANNTQELLSEVKRRIPIEEDNYKVVDVVGSVDKFKAEIQINIDDTAEFIRLYSESNNETLRLDTQNKNSTYYRCKHKTRYQGTSDVGKYLLKNPSNRIQNTNCTFSLVIKGSTHVDFNKLVVLKWNHNHSTTSLHSLTFKDISAETKTKIRKFFDAGLLPGAAHKDLIRQLRSECNSDEDYEEKLADRSIIPRRPDMNRLYGLFTKDMFGSCDVESMFEMLETKLNLLKQESSDYTFKLLKFDEKLCQPFILVVITPLMKRVHQMIANAKDLVFIDSSSNVEEFNLRVFIIVIHSVCGALPLGIIITSDEQLDTLK